MLNSIYKATLFKFLIPYFLGLSEIIFLNPLDPNFQSYGPSQSLKICILLARNSFSNVRHFLAKLIIIKLSF